MRILVACEFSGVVRDAFTKAGHDAWSCDLLPSETPGNHIQGDVLEHISKGWDLMVAHPPCTYLANSGSKHFSWHPRRKQRETFVSRGDRILKMYDAINFFVNLMQCDIPKITIENPIMHKNARGFIVPYSQLIHPYEFGNPETKSICLWLKNLPKLVGIYSVDPDRRRANAYWAPSNKDRWKTRSRFYPEVANAMAEQWGR